MRILFLLLLVGCGKFNPMHPFCHEIEYDIGKVPTLDLDVARFVQTGNFGEQYACLAAPDFITIQEFRSIYSIRLLNLKKDDIIDFRATGQATNDMPSEVMVSWYVILTDSPKKVIGTNITEHHGYNITPEMHHGVIGESGLYKVRADTDSVYLNFIVYAATGHKNIDNEQLNIDLDYGTMSVLVTR